MKGTCLQKLGRFQFEEFSTVLHRRAKVSKHGGKGTGILQRKALNGMYKHPFRVEMVRWLYEIVKIRRFRLKITRFCNFFVRLPNFYVNFSLK